MRGFPHTKFFIYRITSKTTGDFYIGKTVDFERRKIEHIRGINCCYRSLLQCHIEKYGVSDLIFEIIDTAKSDRGLCHNAVENLSSNQNLN